MLQRLLRYAAQEGRKVKPRGSLHSFSLAFVTDDIALNPEGLIAPQRVATKRRDVRKLLIELEAELLAQLRATSRTP